jgi:predicted Fe-S protein YdhL (DUF1289 family)
MTPDSAPHVDSQARVASPCIKVCVLDARNVCVGCGRTIEEITTWSRLTPEQQRLVCERAAQRRSEASRA